MKKRSFPWATTIISIIAVVAIVISVLPSLGLFPASPTATVRPTITPSQTPTQDVCAPANVQTTALDFNTFAREFDDHFTIAQNTPRQNLAPNIAELQRIRRNSEDFSVPDCLRTLRELQLAYMNTLIDALVTLYSTATVEDQPLSEEVILAINQGISLGVHYHEQYLDEMARIMGVTRVPTPTFAEGTQTPSVTP